jgi:hypothetical protein
MASFNLKKWMIISLINLLIVAVLGSLMRYKICFEFHLLDQKNMQHAHSHFAFAGWISQTLMAFMIYYLQQNSKRVLLAKYQTLLYLNLLISLGMLVSFMASGYSLVSIICSTVSILISFVFAWYFWIDSKLIPQIHSSTKWFKAALVFLVLSSLGTFSLAFMMATHQLNQHVYLASIYWYLHFQYNGWFLFACMGLLISLVTPSQYDCLKLNRIFWLFFATCIPAYTLSVLWANLPNWLFAITIVSSVLQTWAWLNFVYIFKSYFMQIKAKSGAALGFILLLLTLAFTVKIFLQLGSTIPEISKLAFGLHPVVIAYLHLVLLAITSVFLVVLMFLNGVFKTTPQAIRLFMFLAACIYINQLLLGANGIAAIDYIVLPYSQELLLGIALVIALSIILLIRSLISQKQPTTD